MDDNLIRRGREPSTAPVTKWLASSLDEAHEWSERLSQTNSGGVVEACRIVEPFCPWEVGYGEASEEFVDSFAYATIIGPGAYFDCSYFAAGLTLVAPDFLYDWHSHPAIELYINLTDQSCWGLEGTTLSPRNFGDTIVHPSLATHAMRSDSKPLLAPWMWGGDVRTSSEMSANSVR